jgi:formamidopyrimidine-DNA glycosylase
MPELPEVETTMRGLAPHLVGHSVTGVVIRNSHLRWPIPLNLAKLLSGQTIRAVTRRAKYILVAFDHGTLILHLGMSGSLRILPKGTAVEKHDHFDMELESGQLMRLHDPRRFGAVLWHSGDPLFHPLLLQLGPEPLLEEFNAAYFYAATRKKSGAIKQLIMHNQVVVGVGNIYANESLFRAGIRPQLGSDKLSKVRCARLVKTIRETLTDAIALGGSSLRDFVNSEGKPGYFQQNYWVYGKAGEPCKVCGSPIKRITQGQRSSFYCPVCQK